MTSTDTSTSQTKDDSDWLDNVCDAATNALCPVPTTESLRLASIDDNKKHADDVMLDHVFEKVETFTCRTQPNEENGNMETKEDTIVIVTPIQQLTKAEIEFESETEPQPATKLETESDPKQAGRNKDVLDYVFEKVESFVCSIAPGDDDENGTETGEYAIHASDDQSIVDDSRSAADRELEMIVDQLPPSSSDAAKPREEAWYKEPKFQMIGSILSVGLVVLIVVGSLLLTKWK